MTTQTIEMLTPYEKLAAMGIELDPILVPGAAFEMAVQSGNLVFVSGHIARRSGASWQGKLGAGIGTEEGKAAARAAAVDLVATLHEFLGDLCRVKRIVKVMSLVNSSTDYTEQHVVTNGASELLREVFGEVGRHARSAFGVAQLPLGACVEIEMVVELHDPKVQS
ncbi:endoribonuclease L-PSP (plasmid) [Cupriavidus necator N-1]|uniref:Endoribonuclease L-PSP n=2 Tax=Cupriavidus necator TaxID=106590 RepID=F8GVJ9_CUPNN|nr:endoribonuclease L-PSP [Cupriavidus necator N-1]